MKVIKIFSACLFLLPFVSCTQVTNDKGDTAIEKKVEALLSKMTLEEKLGQMNQITSYGNIEDMSGLIKQGGAGSILNETDPVRINALQRVAIEESRLSIPLLMARDVIHGFKTIFPIPLGQAASFNPQVAEDGARVAAIEASSVGIRWTFAPMIDIARDPRWGRMAEGCGEDTYLTTVMGVAMVKGFQGDSLNSPTSIASCPKHFVGYGAAEGGRDYNSTFIPERRLRNVYLPPFEAASKAGAATFMTSFNDNDGVPSTGNSFILKDVLRSEWGFDGLVVTDWASSTEMIAHGFAADSKEVAMKAVNAGVDMEMVGNTFVKELPGLIKEGKVKGSTQFVTTRFGNVLGSNGSVIPLFKEQLKNGGPITVTHPDIIRFFMLIPEACKLVIEAGTMGNGGEIYVFDMGKPVRIADLAERMIKLSGAKGIKIEYTGLREGEKLYEEVLNDAEITLPTFHPKIKIAKVREYDYDNIRREIDDLIEKAHTGDDMTIVAKMKSIVVEFKSQHSRFEILDK